MVRSDYLGKEFQINTEVLSSALESDIFSGLSNNEAESRLRIFGHNKFTGKKEQSLFILFLLQFKNPIVYLLFFGAAVSFYFSEFAEGFAILAVILINAVLGFIMEFQARNSMKALEKLDENFSSVFRDGELKQIHSENLVPGDIIWIEAGDIIPADGRIIHCNEFFCDEAALTGESMPVEKMVNTLEHADSLGDQVNMAFKGTSTIRGNAKVLVTRTGMNTELGKITFLVQQSAEKVTPLTRKLEGLSKKLIYVTAGIAIIFIITGIIQDKPVHLILETAIALAVAAIPEGLPIVATIALAYGVVHMARKNAIVKKLDSLETLGGVTVIFTDKTGTLTENIIQPNTFFIPGHNSEVIIEKYFSDSGNGQLSENIRHIFLISKYCNNASLSGNGSGDPLEISLLQFVRKYYPKEVAEAKRIKEIPFSSETKLMFTLHQLPVGFYIAGKGSVEDLVERCDRILLNGKEVAFDEDEKNKLKQIAESLSAQGQRVLGFAYDLKSVMPEGNFGNNLVLVGFIGFLDPPRKEIAKSIRACLDAGITVVMLTGDHPKTAKNIADQIELTGVKEALVLSGNDLKKLNFTNEEHQEKVMSSTVFARVDPKQKLDVVDLFQNKGNIVAMTGDGVNDAPALKKSDVGIAMGLRGTQVARETADIVLKDDSFSSIVSAISHGRAIFDNIRKFVIYLISCNLTEIVVVSVLGFILPGAALLPLQILFLNLITDVFPALALGLTKGNDKVMTDRPRDPDMPILSDRNWKEIIYYSLVMGLIIMTGVLIGKYYYGWDDVAANNITFFSVALAQLWHVFNMSHDKSSSWSNEITQNVFIWIALIFCSAIISIIAFIPFVNHILGIHEVSLNVFIFSTLLSILPLVIIKSTRKIIFG